MKTSFSFFWIAVVLGHIAVTCTGLKKISNAQQLVDLFAAGTAVNEDIELRKDLDFKNTNLVLPLGAKTDDTCVPYTGTFNGKGHMIKNLVMNNAEASGYAGAGLFCRLQNAVVKDLVFDSSCSFTAESSGALSVEATALLTVSKITNKAAVNGTEIVGGIIGYAYDLSNQSSSQIDSCVNEGSVKCTGRYTGGIIGLIENTVADIIILDCTNRGPITAQDMTGGIVGCIQDCINTTVTFSNCMNDNDIDGTELVGGLVGYVGTCTNTVVTIGGSFNNGNILEIQYLGGFIGSFGENENVNVTIFNSINNGMVSCSGTYGECGGFIGSMYSSAGAFVALSNVYNNGAIKTAYSYAGGLLGNVAYSMDIELSLINCTNNGNVTGSLFAGGLVAYFSNEDTESSSRVIVMNSANRGTITATERAVCGLFCADDSTGMMSCTVVNSLNKGNVNAPLYAYGITNNLTRAHNVVSMGQVTESLISFSFWETSTNAKLFYGLKGKCVNCTAATTMFEHNSDTGFYDTVQDGKHVHELLNEEVAKQHFGVEWSSELELIQSFLPSSGVLRALSPLALVFAFIAFFSMQF